MITPVSFAEIKSHARVGDFTTWTANLELHFLPPLHLLLVVDHLPRIGHHVLLLLLLLLKLNSMVLGQVDDCDEVFHQTCVLVIGDVARYDFFSSCAKSCSFYLFLVFRNWDECGFCLPWESQIQLPSIRFQTAVFRHCGQWHGIAICRPCSILNCAMVKGET